MMVDQYRDESKAVRAAKQGQIDRAFTYHPPKDGQADRYERIRDECKLVADVIVDNTPASREQSLALTKLEEVVMWANAAIARNE